MSLVCATCGRATLWDGRCYGCECDRLLARCERTEAERNAANAEVKRLREGMEWLQRWELVDCIHGGCEGQEMIESARRGCMEWVDAAALAALLEVPHD